MSEQGSLKFLNTVSKFRNFDRILDFLNFHISPGSMLNIAHNRRSAVDAQFLQYVQFCV